MFITLLTVSIIVFSLAFIICIVSLILDYESVVLVSYGVLCISAIFILVWVPFIPNTTFYNIKCDVDGEIVYIETSQELPEFDLYDTCLIEVLREGE